MAEATRRIEIGFDGGQVLAVRVESEALEQLRGKLGSGEWLRLSAEDGELDLDLDEVSFVRVAGEGQGVGFGSG